MSGLRVCVLVPWPWCWSDERLDVPL